MTRMRGLSLLALLLALLLAIGAVGCGGDEEVPPPAGEEEVEGQEEEDGEAIPEGISGEVSIMGVWTGDEQQSFQAVLDGFTERNPDVTINYNPAGDQLPTVLATAVEGGNPPDIATIAQPGLVADLAGRGELQPLDFAEDTLRDNFADSVLEIGTIDDTLYGFIFKAANKSTLWYNVSVFEEAGVEPPGTWDELLESAGTLQAAGYPAYSIGGADGWTLTDLFENIYLRTAGPDLYDQLSEHEIPWTHESVIDALNRMAEILGDTENIAGGVQGALQTDFPTSVTRVFADPPEAAMVIEGDFVAGVILESTDAEPETGFNVVDFPAIDDSPPSVMGGGDTVVLFTENEAARALIEYFATAEAATLWAEQGGFSTANQNVDAEVYPDEITRETATALAEAEIFRFDLSDLQPAEFGGTVGQGLFRLFQDFVRNPDDAEGIAQQIEQAAARAHGNR